MKKQLYILMLIVLSIAACRAEPEIVTVRETVVHEVEVTRQVEVTRLVEATREVITTEEVEVTREVEVEVTRIVELVVTATQEPTLEPTNTPVPNTPAPQPAAPTATVVPNVTTTLLSTLYRTRDNLISFGGMIDAALWSGVINCQAVVDTYDAIANAPTYDVFESDATTQYAYNAYRSAVQSFTSGAWDMTQNCRDFLANPSGGGIPFQQWGAARQNVNIASDMLNPAIQALEG